MFEKNTPEEHETIYQAQTDTIFIPKIEYIDASSNYQAINELPESSDIRIEEPEISMRLIPQRLDETVFPPEKIESAVKQVKKCIPAFIRFLEKNIVTDHFGKMCDEIITEYRKVETPANSSKIIDEKDCNYIKQREYIEQIDKIIIKRRKWVNYLSTQARAIFDHNKLRSAATTILSGRIQIIEMHYDKEHPAIKLIQATKKEWLHKIEYDNYTTLLTKEKVELAKKLDRLILAILNSICVFE